MKISSTSMRSSILVQIVVLVLFVISVLIIDGSGGEGGVVLAIATATDNDNVDNNDDVDDPHLTSVKQIYDWINAAENGYVNIAKQQPQRLIKNDISTPLIIIATADIEKNELLVQTPWTHILGPESDDEEEDDEDDNEEDEDEDEGWYCGTVRTLAKEMKLGNKSFYGPYVTYLNNEPDNQLPPQYTSYCLLFVVCRLL